MTRIPETVSGPLFFLPVGLSNQRNIRNAVEGNHCPAEQKNDVFKRPKTSLTIRPKFSSFGLDF